MHEPVSNRVAVNFIAGVIFATILTVTPCLAADPNIPTAATAEYIRSLNAQARSRAQEGTHEYFAILRRGMDWYDREIGSSDATPANFALVPDFDLTVTDADRDPDGQALTAKRAGIAYEPIEILTRRAFTSQLAAIARERAGGNPDLFYAIARRGMDFYDREVGKTEGKNVTWDAESFRRLDQTPSDQDATADGQSITALRLGLDFENKRIIGGMPVPKGAAEEVVFILSDGWICTGTAMNSATVLTAAHCICDMDLTPEHRNSSGQVFITHNYKEDRSSRFKIDVTKTSLFPNYDCGLSLGENLRRGRSDLALIGVQDDRKMKVPSVSVAPLEQVNAALNRTKPASFFLYGFGCTVNSGSSCPLARSEAKNYASIRSSYQCDTGPHGVPADYGHYPASQICAPGSTEFVLSNYGAARPIDTCHGDSGGPVFLITDGDDVRRRFLAGTTSRGLAATDSCGYGGIYTKIDSPEAHSWLKSHGVVP